MIKPHEPVNEIDLLAYADGTLDGDPARRAEVEEYLKQHPEQAERIIAFMHQDDDIHRLYDPILDEPVPDRLRAVLEQPQSGRYAQMLMRTGFAASILLAASGGWYLGRTIPSDDLPQRDSIAASALDGYRNGIALSDTKISSSQAPVATVHASGPEWSNTISSMAGHIMLQIRVPDLSAQGYHLQENREIDTDGGNAVQIGYVNDTGDKLVLLLQPRWNTGVYDLRVDERDGFSVVTWADGPITFGLASGIKAGQAYELATFIRESTQSVEFSDPARLPDLQTPRHASEPEVAQSDPVIGSEISGGVIEAPVFRQN